MGSSGSPVCAAVGGASRRVAAAVRRAGSPREDGDADVCRAEGHEPQPLRRAAGIGCDGRGRRCGGDVRPSEERPRAHGATRHEEREWVAAAVVKCKRRCPASDAPRVKCDGLIEDDRIIPRRGGLDRPVGSARSRRRRVEGSRDDALLARGEREHERAAHLRVGAVDGWTGGRVGVGLRGAGGVQRRRRARQRGPTPAPRPLQGAAPRAGSCCPPGS